MVTVTTASGLGYYTTAKGQVNGNLALLDQQMALKWVRDNIERFSGDVRRITIAGEDAGSEAVSLHVISPMSSGLFSSAISFGPTMVQKHLPRPGDLGELSAEFAGQVGCQSDSESSVLSCLRRKDARQLNAVNVSFPFVVDGAFLPDDPLSLWNRSIANPVNYVIGCRSHDTDPGEGQTTQRCHEPEHGHVRGGDLLNRHPTGRRVTGQEPTTDTRYGRP